MPGLVYCKVRNGVVERGAEIVENLADNNSPSEHRSFASGMEGGRLPAGFGVEVLPGLISFFCEKSRDLTFKSLGLFVGSINLSKGACE